MTPDGFSVVYFFKNYDHYNEWLASVEYDIWEEWSATTGIRKETVIVDKKTGDKVKTITLKGAIETYSLNVFETLRVNSITGDERASILLKMKGSLHGNHFRIKGDKGKWIRQNFDRFTFLQLVDEIDQLCDKAKINPNGAIIRSIEFGVNISTAFSVDTFIERGILLHKTKCPQRYAEGFGIFFDHENPIKIYNKGKQFCLGRELMRIEIAFKEMKALKPYGIRTLMDLKCEEKLKQLSPLLLNTVDDLLLYDHNIDYEKCRHDESALLYKGANEKFFWNDLLKKDRDKFYRLKKIFKSVANHNGADLNNGLKALAMKEINTCFGIEDGKDLKHIENTNSAVSNDGEESTYTKHKLGIMINSDFVFINDNDIVNNNKEDELINLNITDNIKKEEGKRYCISCKRDITGQRGDSKFCSSKFAGKENAKRCRNKISNKKYREKQKLNKSIQHKPVVAIQDNNLSIPVTPIESRTRLKEILARIKAKYADTG